MCVCVCVCWFIFVVYKCHSDHCVIEIKKKKVFTETCTFTSKNFILEQNTVIWVFFACKSFPGINIPSPKNFLQSRVIVKIKYTKIKHTKLLLQCQMRDVMELEEFRVDVCVRGYHMYKDIWYAAKY